MKRLPKILLGASAAIGGGYLGITATKIAPTSRLQFTSSSENPRDFAQSRSYALANPRGHVAFTETLSVTMEVPLGSPLEKLTDEQILARVMKGYLGGWVIAPERWYLRARNADLVQLQEIPEPLPNIWRPSGFSDNRLPPPHTKLIGGFLVLENHIEDSGTHSRDTYPRGTRSYIDLGFGYNKPGSSFCGVDRIAVTREPESPTGSSNDTASLESAKDNPCRSLRITYSAMACNPSVNEMTLPKLILTVHKSYARLLFREGIARVLSTT